MSRNEKEGKTPLGERVLAKELGRILENFVRKMEIGLFDDAPDITYKIKDKEQAVQDILAKLRATSIVKLLSTAKPAAKDEAVDKVAKWLAAVIENGEPYDGFENMAWSEFAGGEDSAEPYRELAAELLSIYQPEQAAVERERERIKKMIDLMVWQRESESTVVVDADEWDKFLGVFEPELLSSKKASAQKTGIGRQGNEPVKKE